uniref:Protein RFT1 homolog n=1 Tax=Clastoptera arizonana TaxID=38151 RepID=A0A1B6DLV9_9HEMI
MGKNFLKSSLEDASFNIIFQILFRCMTFLMNAFVLRHVNQAIIGVMNVRLLLLESTILFLSREAFRRACLSKSSEHNWRQVINLVWLTTPLCCTMCFIFGWLWLFVLEPPDSNITEHYKVGVLAIVISCIIEMFVEPMYLVAQAFLFVRLRVVMDTINVVVRTTIFTTLVLWWPEGAVIAFSTAQIGAVLIYVACYYLYFNYYTTKRKIDRIIFVNKLKNKSTHDDDFPFVSLKDFFPQKLQNEPAVDWKLCVLTWSFLKQGFLKQILTEGERYIMTLFSVLTFYEQGVFDVVNNLGSLAARFLFRPIEESSYFYFSQLVHRDKTIDEQHPSQMKEAATVLCQLLRFVVSLGLMALSFGQAYARLVLLLYGGPSLADGLAPLLLKTHCLAVLLVAVNGTTECYSLATMNTKQLNRYNTVMAGLSIGFLLVSWIFTYFLGSVGFILANCCNMAARIFYCILFIKGRYAGTLFTPLDGLIPTWKFLFFIVLSLVVTIISEIYYYETSKITHFLVGIICVVIVLAVWMNEEKELIQLGVEKWKRKQSLKIE